MDIVQQYTHEVAIQMQHEIEQTIINYLRKEGYDIDDNPSPQDIKELMEFLESQGKRLRVEVFAKWSGNFTVTTAILPFFESIDKGISRREIYSMLNLAEQGYQI